MANDPTNGGRRIGKLEMKDAVQDTVIEELVKSVKEVHDMVANFMAPGGICDQHRNKVSSMHTHMKVQWWILGILVTLVIGVAGVALRHIATGG